mgnify:CR=1 FL=1
MTHTWKVQKSAGWELVEAERLFVSADGSLVFLNGTSKAKQYGLVIKVIPGNAYLEVDLVENT